MARSAAVRWALRGVACCAVALPMTSGIARHPLHTTITTIVYDGATHRLTATVRVFADDLAKAIARRDDRRAPAGADAATFDYINATVAVIGPDGRPAALEWCGSRATGDLRWLCVQATVAAGIHGVRIRDAVLTELFDDQINIVMAGKAAMLFTKGDGAKPLQD